MVINHRFVTLLTSETFNHHLERTEVDFQRCSIGIQMVKDRVFLFVDPAQRPRCLSGIEGVPLYDLRIVRFSVDREDGSIFCLFSTPDTINCWQAVLSIKVRPLSKIFE